MDPSSLPGTSFIPKKAIIEEPVRRGESTVGLVTAFIVIAFLVTLVVAGGMFVWEKASSLSLVKSKRNLEEQKAKFQPEVISQFKRIDDRMSASSALIAKHHNPNKFLSLLQSVTYKDVSFSSVSYNRDEKEGIKATLKGEARDYQTIILQSDFLNTNKYVKEYLFTNLVPKESGRISFDVALIIEPGFALTREDVSSLAQQ